MLRRKSTKEGQECYSTKDRGGVHLKWGGSGGLPETVTFAESLEGDKGEGAIWNLGEAVWAEGTARAKALRPM